MSNYLLSICIPTYNRAETLADSLRRIVENPEVDERVEIIVSDNASTDYTRQVVAEFPRVKYFCNPSNVRDSNFSIVLGYASGKYLKLTNDTTFYQPGAIGQILAVIEQLDDSRPALYFCQNTFNYYNTQEECRSFDRFLEVMSVNLTWTNAFGMWRDQFIAIEDKDRMVALQFAQVDWSLRNFDQLGEAMVCFDDFLDFVPLPKKGGYNVIRTFVVNYPSIIAPYVQEGKISSMAFAAEIKRLYEINIKKWLPGLYINRGASFEFDMSGVWPLLYQTYGKKSYFWLSLPTLFFRMGVLWAKSVARPLVRKLKSGK